MRYYQDYIDDILDNFEFERMHKVMKYLDWKWATTSGVPSVSDLRRKARSLLKDTIEALQINKQYYCATGGLAVTGVDCDDGLYLRLDFVLTSWEADCD